MNTSVQARKESLQWIITQSREAFLRSWKKRFYKVGKLFIRRAFLNNSGKEKSSFLHTYEFPPCPGTACLAQHRQGRGDWGPVCGDAPEELPLRWRAVGGHAGVSSGHLCAWRHWRQRCSCNSHLILQFLGPHPRWRVGSRVEGGCDPHQLKAERKRKTLAFVWGSVVLVQCGGSNPNSTTRGSPGPHHSSSLFKGGVAPQSPIFFSLFVAKGQKWHHSPSDHSPSLEMSLLSAPVLATLDLGEQCCWGAWKSCTKQKSVFTLGLMGNGRGHAEPGNPEWLGRGCVGASGSVLGHGAGSKRPQGAGVPAAARVSG